ncbi:MAG: hypothetical protein HY952_03975 [Elusimicrobia bacterium]|nr:hypothetical protein [Elusimicrobiota bacterium]
MKNSLKACLAAVLLAGCAGAPARNPAKAPPAQLQAEGVTALNLRDLGASRAAAVLDAERAAVSRTAELFLDDEAWAEKFSAVEAGLLKAPNLYVSKYKILSEGADGAFYRVRLNVWVQHARVGAELRALKLAGPAAAGPRAAFALRGPAAPAFAAAFKEAFTRRASAVIEDFPFAADQALLAGSDEGLAAAASAAGADLLITASASASAAGAGLNTGFFPSKADASVKVYELPGGRLLADASNQANGIDSSEAASFAKALGSAGELLAQETASKVSRSLKQAAPVKLKFLGFETLEAVEKLRAQLNKLDARGLRLENYDGAAAVFQCVPRRPDPQEFASTVLRGDSLGLELEGVGPQEIVFSLPR